MSKNIRRGNSSIVAIRIIIILGIKVKKKRKRKYTPINAISVVLQLL